MIKRFGMLLQWQSTTDISVIPISGNFGCFFFFEAVDDKYHFIFLCMVTQYIFQRRCQSRKHMRSLIHTHKPKHTWKFITRWTKKKHTWVKEQWETRSVNTDDNQALKTEWGLNIFVDFWTRRPKASETLILEDLRS